MSAARIVLSTEFISSVHRSVMSNSLQPSGHSPPGSCQWDSPGKNTRVGCHSLLQGIFPTQGSNQALLHWRQIFYHLSHQGNPSLPIDFHKNSASILHVQQSATRLLDCALGFLSLELELFSVAQSWISVDRPGGFKSPFGRKNNFLLEVCP